MYVSLLFYLSIYLSTWAFPINKLLSMNENAALMSNQQFKAQEYITTVINNTSVVLIIKKEKNSSPVKPKGLYIKVCGLTL